MKGPTWDLWPPKALPNAPSVKRTHIWACETLPCMGLQMEHSGQLGSAMWMSLVPLTRAGTVGHGNKYLIAGFGEDVRGKVWRRFMQPPLQALLKWKQRIGQWKWKQRIGQWLEAFGLLPSYFVLSIFLIFLFSSFFFFLEGGISFLLMLFSPSVCLNIISSISVFSVVKNLKAVVGTHFLQSDQ